MLVFINFIYASLFCVLANIYPIAEGNALRLVGATVLFVALDLSAGYFVSGAKSRRLRTLSHGCTLLISFCASLIVSIALHALMLINMIEAERITLIHSIAYCTMFNFILFWSGIICVYLTSVQLGIKLRVIGLICGMIPIANLVALCYIIKNVQEETRFEIQKEKLNEKRRPEAICAAKYPIFFVHGVFFRDSKTLNYWGRVPAYLEFNGAECFYGEHQSAASVKDSAEELAERIKTICTERGCEKLNIIAHSKGGLDCRYAIEHCGIAERVASLTTVNTPHRGCEFADWLLSHAPERLKITVASAHNKAAKIAGDKAPDFLAAVCDLRASACEEFDKITPIPRGIFCQSVGSVMKGASGGKFPLNLSYNFVKAFDGKNDGLVGVGSFEWGEKFTLLDLPLDRGISHGDMIDLNRENIKGFDVREFYAILVNDLKIRGL